MNIKIADYDGDGVGGVIKTENYFCSILNYLPRLVPDKVNSMEKHDNTDECFILLRGKAMIFYSFGIDNPDEINSLTMEKGKIYNIPAGTWHCPVMTEDAKIILVENSYEGEENSPRKSLTESQMHRVRALGLDFAE